MAPFPTVSRHLLLSVAAVMVVGWSGVPALHAQGTPAAGATVEARNVQFTKVRAPGGGNAWLETTVELSVQATPGVGDAGRFADRVQVTLYLALGSGESGFFRASAEAVSLEPGRAAFRFYLPPEVVKREQLNTDPYAYAVEITVRGRPVPIGAGGAAPVVRFAEGLQSLKDRVSRAAPMNDGILLPQYLSPFAATYAADTPSFVRRER